MKLYLVEHIIKINGFSEGKIMGVVSDKEKAEELIKDYQKKKGFKNYKKGFRIKKMEINKSYHRKGFKFWYKKGVE